MLENTNNIIPTSYQVKVAVKQYAQEQIEYETVTKLRCPNYLHSDGKIYASKPNEPYVAVSVSPYHENFKSQIEESVWPVVEAFTNKGYLTVSSCGGHKDPWWEFYVTLTVGTTDQIDSLIKNLSAVDHTHLEVFNTSANVLQYLENNKIKFRPLDDLEKNLVNEYKDLNILFNRDYKQYYYIKIRFDFEKFKSSLNPFNLFAHHIFHKKEIEEFDKWKQNLLKYLKSDKFEFFYG